MSAAKASAAVGQRCVAEANGPSKAIATIPMCVETARPGWSKRDVASTAEAGSQKPACKVSGSQAPGATIRIFASMAKQTVARAAPTDGASLPDYARTDAGRMIASVETFQSASMDGTEPGLAGETAGGESSSRA